MKLRKRGTEYSLFLVVVMIILVTTTIVNMWGKFNQYKERTGTTQFYLMDAYEKGEIVQHYIDFSARQVLMEGIYTGSITGFMYGLSCGIGENYGYKLINSDEGSCAPSVSTNLALYIKEILPTYTEKFQDVGMPTIDYNMLFSETSDGFMLYGYPGNHLKIEIMPEFKGKCCVGSTNAGPLYFSVSEGECYESAPEILTSYRSIKEVEDENCINREDIVVSESPFILRNPPTEEQEIIQGSNCGDTIVKIAEKGIGFPYFFGSGEWDPERLPLEPDDCSNIILNHADYGEDEWAEIMEEWEEIVRMTGKCPTDSSAFTKWVYNYYSNQEKDGDFTIPVRNAEWQAENIGFVVDHDPTQELDVWEEITPNCEEFQKGDLIFFANTSKQGISHVGIYYGDCQFIHVGNNVEIKSLEEEEWNKHYIGGKRVCSDSNLGNSLISGRAVDVLEDNEITETSFEFIPKAEEEPVVFEQFKSCEETGGDICTEGKSCFGLSISAYDTSACCMGTCKNQFEAKEVPTEYLPEEQKEIIEYTKAGNEYVPPKKEESQIPDKKEDNNLVIPTIVALVITLLIVFAFFYIKKKKIIVFSTMGVFVILAFAFLLISQPQDNQITGKVTYEQLSDQQKNVCQVANAYDIPGTILLTIAEKESGGDHYRNGGVLVTGDGGVGIMQITGRKDCGNSEIDGHKLDIYKVNDNIECGAKILLEKCNAYNCHSSSKEYDCYNSEFSSIPDKHVVYRGWDMALRLYNGWGCRAPTFENEDNYEDIVRAIQSYVEDFHTTAVQFQDACPNDIEWDPSSTTTKPVDELTETLDLIALSKLMKELSTGFYFINPEINEESDVDLVSIHNDMAFASNELITETLDCAFYDYTCEGILPKDICLDINGNYQSCSNDGQTLECYNFITPTTTYSYDYECKFHFDQPLCIGQDGQEKLCKDDGQEMKCRDLDVTYKECAQEVLDENGKDDWNIDYCTYSSIESDCYTGGGIWDGTSCIEKPDDYDESSTLKFCIETGETVYAYSRYKYSELPVNVRFAVTMHSEGVKEIPEMEYSEPSTIQSTGEYSPGTGEIYDGPHMEIFNQVKADMGGTYKLYTDCTNDINKNAWCWVHSGCHGIGIYCKRDKLESAGKETLNTLFKHEITHNLQHMQGGCSGQISSEWGAEYNSGSKYYRFIRNGKEWTAQQLAQILISNGCSPSLLQKAAICNSAAYSEMNQKGCLLGNGEVASGVT